METEKNSRQIITPIRVLLADDHDILRKGLKLLFQVQHDIQVAGEASTGREATVLAENLKPDVVVMDISMADIDGLEACQRIRHREPGTQVLILTMHESEEYFLQSLRMGAAGYLVKKAAAADLISAVRTIASGGVYLYPNLARALVRAYLTSHLSPPQPIASLSQDTEEKLLPISTLDLLTPREREVLKLVAAGRTNQEIADQFVLSIKTVQAHRANLMEKLGLHDITHLVRFAIQHGLLPPEA